jgi:cytochrome P450
MSPPAGSALLREVVDGGSIIDGVYVPEGYDVGVGVYSLHHNPAYWPEPYKYEPGRWLQSDDLRSPIESDRKAYAPFGAGPRSCVGRPLAVLELMLTMASLLVEFDFRPSGLSETARKKSDMFPAQFYLKDHVTGQKDGPFIEFQKR